MFIKLCARNGYFELLTSLLSLVALAVGVSALAQVPSPSAPASIDMVPRNLFLRQRM
jgi:hypothetical protein